MNAIFIDLESVADAQMGDWVTLWGDERLRIDEVAQCAGVNPEAIECGLAKKHRVQLGGQHPSSSANPAALSLGA